MVDILEKIEEIRKKPEHIRRRYVFVIVFVCVIVIFSIWMITVKNSFKENTDTNETERMQILKDVKDEIINTQKKEVEVEVEERKENLFDLNQ